MPIVDKDYFLQEDVVYLAQDMIGKVLITNVKGKICSGIITETEAYNGIVDKACHSYNGLRTKRTETMYLRGGHTYVYLCYGIHHLFNIVTSSIDDPKAILIRSVKPLSGINEILRRRKTDQLNSGLCAGPGKVSQALGITTQHNGLLLKKNLIWIEEGSMKIKRSSIQSGPRIGVDYAGEDAKLPYRFYLSD